MAISTLTSIHPEAALDQDVSVDAFSTIHKNVRIGEGTWIGSNVTIFPGTTIGKNCRIFPGAVLGAVPQDLKFGGEVTTVEIGDNTTIRECVTINRGTTDKYKTVVGSNCLLMAYAHVAHDCIVGDHCILANAVQVGGHVEIDDYAILGGMTGAHQFVKVGKHAIVAGASVIRKDVPPFVTAGREPLAFCGVNFTGLRRRGFSKEDVAEIQALYRILYHSSMNISKATAALREDAKESAFKADLLGFIERADRGLIRG